MLNGIVDMNLAINATLKHVTGPDMRIIVQRKHKDIFIKCPEIVVSVPKLMSCLGS